jgi:predicted transcriptional regulator
VHTNPDPVPAAVDEYPLADLSSVPLIDVLKALSDPIRFNIVQLLGSGEPMNRNTTDWGCDLSRATMSHHFRILREVGLTRTFANGRAHRVQLRSTEIEARFPGLLRLISRG